MRIETFIDGVNHWAILINEGYDLNDELKETIRTIEVGMDNKIGFALIGNSSVCPFVVDEHIDFEAVDQIVYNDMAETLHTPPDFNTMPFKDDLGEWCGGLLTMNTSVGAFIDKNNLELNEDEKIDFICGLLYRSKLLQDCENGKIIGYLVPITYYKDLDVTHILSIYFHSKDYSYKITESDKYIVEYNDQRKEFENSFEALDYFLIEMDYENIGDFRLRDLKNLRDYQKKKNND